MTEGQGWLDPCHSGSASQLTQTNQRNHRATLWGGQEMGRPDQPNEGRALASGESSIWGRGGWAFLIVKPADYFCLSYLDEAVTLGAVAVTL